MPKYDIHATKKLKFARFGGLSSVNQRGYDAAMETFHSPPASRGFYCFVWPFYEMFLLGADCTKAPFVPGAKFTYVRDKNGEIVTDKHPDAEKYSGGKYWTCESKQSKEWRKKYPDPETPNYYTIVAALDKEWEEKYSHVPRWVYVEKPSPRIFEHSGVLWHHLSNTVRPAAVLARKGSWVKTTVEDYREALEKEMHAAQKEQMQLSKGFYGKKQVEVLAKKTSLKFGFKDHLECFIEKL